MKFKPQLVPTLFTIPGVILLLVLGTWQMQRLQWKDNMVAELNERSSLPAVGLPSVVEKFSDFEYRRVRVVGEFLHDKEVHLFTGPKSARGRPGYDVLTPLKRADGSVVLVDRGWVDSDSKKPENRLETLVDGFVEVEGMVHKGELQKGFTPDNDVVKNLWFWIDISAIESYTGNQLQNMYVRALKKEGVSDLPIAGDAVIKRRNDHLQYAVTWYGLAIVLLVIYVLYHRKQA